MKEVTKDAKNLRYLKIFLLVFIALVFISVIYKIVVNVSTSRFTSNTFNFAVVGQQTYIVHLDTSDNSLTYVTVNGNPTAPIDLSPLSYSVYFGVPIHGIIFDTQHKPLQNIDTRFFSLSHILNIISNPEYKKIGLNTTDIIKIYLAQKSVPYENKQFNSINYRDFVPQNFDRIDAVFFSLFKNTDVINKKISVQIINATDVNGLGNRVSRVFSNWGYDVVSVISDSDYTSSEIILRTDDAYTKTNLQQIFGFPIHMDQGQAIANIIIVVAGDHAERISF